MGLSNLPNRQRRWQRFYYPLLLISGVLHSLLLVAPLPSQPEPATETEAPASEETEAVDLLSIAELPTAEPPAAAPPPESTSPAPSPPDPRPTAPQPVAPEQYPEEPVPSQPTDPLPPEEPAPDETGSPASNFTIDPARQNQALAGIDVIGRTGSSNFNITDLFPYGAWGKGLNNLPEGERGCFFGQISQDSYDLVAGATQLLYISRNIEFVERDDLAQSFEARGYDLVKLDSGYCNHPLIAVQEAGQPLLYISLIDLKGTTIVIFWSSDPRNA